MNEFWRIRRLTDDIDHYYEFEHEGPTVLLCTREEISTFDHRAHQVKGDSVAYLHPANTYLIRQDDKSLPDTPINECPDCLSVLVMRELSE